jgi:hypothetical protein
MNRPITRPVGSVSPGRMSSSVGMGGAYRARTDSLHLRSPHHLVRGGPLSALTGWWAGVPRVRWVAIQPSWRLARKVARS